ncbi:hypothetical protein WA158_002311 [Blastocystis sp. Blastoise]
MLRRFFATGIRASKESLRVLDEAMTIPKMPAFVRSTIGTNAADILRESGAIPGVLYGDDGKGNKEKILIAVPRSEVIRYINKLNVSLECTVFDLMLENQVVRVFPRQLQCHPTTEVPIALNFLRYNQVKGTRIEIPLEVYNLEKNVELKLGNLLNIPRKYIQVKAFGDIIPKTVLCNLEKLTFGKPLKVTDLELDLKAYKVDPLIMNSIIASIPTKKKV